MAIRIVPHSIEHRPAVEAFNHRMRDAGSQWGFYPDPVPEWIPQRPGATAWREFHLAIENAEIVRGGYALKPQHWQVNGEIEVITDWQGPFTEAAIDTRFSPLGLRILREMLKQYPFLFSFGHGGNEEPMVQLLRKLDWTLHGVPFCFKVLKPFRFLTRNTYLRSTFARRALLDVLAYTGLGWLGVRTLQTLQRLSHRAQSAAAQVEVVDSFGEWADELWAECRGAYRCLAVRDKKMMNDLMPAEGWPGGERLKITRNGSVIGWSVVLHKKMTDDPRFGSLHVGLISDSFAAPADAAAVIAASHEYLATRDVDLVYANQSHPDWVEGFRANGYIVLPERRLFAISPAMRERLEPWDETIAGLHLTNMDGHGPHGFEQ